VEAQSSPPPAEGRPAWPAWYGIGAILAGLVAALLLSIVIIGLFAVGGANVSDQPPSLALVLTVVQDACWVLAVLGFAGRITRPRAWQFGLRGTRFWRAVGWAALALGISIVASLVYVKAFHVHVKQSTLKELGAGNGAFVTALIGVLVVGVAPVVEEFVFRGFLYGTLRTRFSFLPAAALDGLIFGGIHATTGVSAIPPLIVLGFVFCMVYEATGSILPTICLHALNNMIAFGGDKDGSWAAGGVTAAIVVASAVAIGASTRRPLPGAA
jgi:membrane protease YdiL (CAAX protease family)